MLTTHVRQIAIVGVMLFALACAPTASANITFKPVGHPFGADGWSQQFSLVSTTPFENLGIVLVPTADDDGTSGFAAGAWELSGANGSAPGYVQSFAAGDIVTGASGGSTNQLLWQTRFTGTRTGQAFALTLFVYDDILGGSSAQTASVKWDGSWWSVNTSPGVTWEQYQDSVRGAATIVPAPSALLLGIIGLALVGGAWRLRR